MNIVDEMQLGVISLEKTFALIKDYTRDLLMKTLRDKEQELKKYTTVSFMKGNAN